MIKLKLNFLSSELGASINTVLGRSVFRSVEKIVKKISKMRCLQYLLLYRIDMISTRTVPTSERISSRTVWVNSTNVEQDIMTSESCDKHENEEIILQTI